MKFSSWLDALRGSRSGRPIRRAEPRRPSASGKLSVEDLEARTVPAFLTPVDYSTGTYPIAVISADFNGDSIPDTATANYYDSSVSVRLGNSMARSGLPLLPRLPITPTRSRWATSTGMQARPRLVETAGGTVHLGSRNGSFQAGTGIGMSLFTGGRRL